MRVALLLVFVFAFVSAEFNAVKYWDQMKEKANDFKDSGRGFLDGIKDKFFKANESENEGLEAEVPEQNPEIDDTENQDDELILTEPGFIEGFIQGLQKNPNRESQCLGAYRAHKEVINAGIAAAFENMNGNMMQGLMNVALILGNTTDLFTKCEILTILANVGGNFSVAGIIGMITRFGKSSWRLTRAMAVVRFSDFHSIGKLIGVFFSIIVNVQLTE